MNSKIVLVCDSHAISAYQRCPELYRLSTLRGLEPVTEYLPFKKGSIIAEMLEAYYNILIERPIEKNDLIEIVAKHLLTSDLNQEIKDLIEFRFYRYWKFYKNDIWKPIACEGNTAFSKVIYEDSQHLFIYEGRPDLHMYWDRSHKKRAITDHKSQGYSYEYYPHNNQALGYCWGLETDTFFYNFFGLQETGKPEDWFHRSSKIFTKEQIETWKQNTIQWFFKITRDQDYVASLQCTTKFGTCAFHQICEQPKNWVKEGLLRRNFKQREHKVW